MHASTSKTVEFADASLNELNVGQHRFQKTNQLNDLEFRLGFFMSLKCKLRSIVPWVWVLYIDIHVHTWLEGWFKCGPQLSVQLVISIDNMAYQILDDIIDIVENNAECTGHMLHFRQWRSYYRILSCIVVVKTELIPLFNVQYGLYIIKVLYSLVLPMET